MIHKFTNGRVILGNTIADGVSVYTKDDKIIAVTRDEREYDVLHDAGGKYISPGFIDIHVHGGFGTRFEDSIEDALTMAENHAKFGTTTLLGTASAKTTEEYVKMFENFREVQKRTPRARISPVFIWKLRIFQRIRRALRDRSFVILIKRNTQCLSSATVI